jgi:hypothetical protein
MQSFVMNTLPEDSAAGDFGGIKTIYTAVGSLGPTYIGVVSSQFGFTIGYVSLVSATIPAAIILISVARSSETVGS